MSMLPHTNLPLMLPLLQNEPPHNFSVKDQHLLKPPSAMGAAGGFGRRASDGGANLLTFFQKNIEHSDWSTVQQQKQQSIHMDSVHHLSNPLAINTSSTPSHVSPGSQTAESLEDSSNSVELTRYLLLEWKFSFILINISPCNISVYLYLRETLRSTGIYIGESGIHCPWLIQRKLNVFNSRPLPECVNRV